MVSGGREVWVVDPSLFTLPYDHELCQALADRAHQVRLVARPLRPLEQTVSTPRYEHQSFFYPTTDTGTGRRRFGKGLEHWSGMRRLTAEVQRLKPDLLHFQWLPLPLIDRSMLGAMAQCCPLVLTVHDATARGGRGFAALQRLGWLGALRHFSRLVVHNEAGREVLVAAGVAAESVVVIPHPILPLPANDCRTEPLEPLLMLFGEIKPYKGVDLAIEALAQLPERLSTLRLVIAGRPRMPLHELQNLARDRGVAHRVEWIDRYISLQELPSLLGSAAIFLFPYREADASGVLSQVLQLGRPIVASRTGVFPELVGGGRCGVVVEPGDAAGLAAAITSIIDDPAKAAEMGERARRLSKSMPSWASMAEQLTDLYELIRPESRQGQ